MATKQQHQLFPRFEQRLTAVGGECHQVESIEEAARVIATHAALQEREIVVPPGFSTTASWETLARLLEKQGIRLREADSAAGVADAPAGLSGAELAVAETGSVLLAENSLRSRVVSMLTLTHFVLVRSSSLVPMLDDAGARMQELTKAGQGRYLTLITGPSRTSDIERVLTIGVQGPKSLCVIIVKTMDNSED